jgi:hypothetical protein
MGWEWGGLTFCPCVWLQWTNDISASMQIIGKTSSFVKKSFIDVFDMGYRIRIQRAQARNR